MCTANPESRSKMFFVLGNKETLLAIWEDIKPKVISVGNFYLCSS
jgi:hypothetical protein